MKRWFVLGGIVLIALLLVGFSAVSAGETYPEGVTVFEVEGELFVLFEGENDDILLQICPCDEECEIITPTPTPVFTPTKTPKTATPTPKTPTPTITPQPECFQWLCHMPGTSAEQNYCCDSLGCVDAHLKHGDYLGTCKP